MLPVNALDVHLQMADIPIMDTAALAVLGNDDLLLRLLRNRASQGQINDYVAWTLHATRTLGLKVINAGGANAFKSNVRQFGLDDIVPDYGVSSRQILQTLQRATCELGIPHPVHVHCNNLGIPGNVDTALATMEAAQGLPMHLAHVQFYAYGLGNLRLEALRNRIAVVGRAEFFRDSIFENVRLGRSELGQDEVKQVLDAVGLLDDVAGLSEDGLDTDLSPSGAPLSAAQGRLLLLARAIAGRPALLILDGILDEMDEAARERIAPALFADDAPWTLLVLTGSPNVAALCGRTVALQGVDGDA